VLRVLQKGERRGRGLLLAAMVVTAVFESARQGARVCRGKEVLRKKSRSVVILGNQRFK